MQAKVGGSQDGDPGVRLCLRAEGATGSGSLLVRSSIRLLRRFVIVWSRFRESLRHLCHDVFLCVLPAVRRNLVFGVEVVEEVAVEDTLEVM